MVNSFDQPTLLRRELLDELTPWRHRKTYFRTICFNLCAVHFAKQLYSNGNQSNWNNICIFIDSHWPGQVSKDSIEARVMKICRSYD